ncbi:MAG: M48 family metalloprotease, partial [Alphaproteobacteria bacterium]|nr:M48 family metalloprotease [Alphaproteobacteria bacterium]
MNNNIEDKYLKVIEDNVNVSKTGAGTEFLVTISAVAIICFCVFIFSDAIANVVIDNMSDEKQVKIENILTGKDSDFKIVVKHPDKLKYLEETKKRIISIDKRLQRKSVLKINEIEEKQVNAFVLPNGSIYFTSGLLDKVDNKEALTFVLAHELGHYAHRDHLKSIGRELLSGMILSVISFGNKQVGSTFSSFNNMNYIN